MRINSGRFLDAFPGLQKYYGESTEFDLDIEFTDLRVKFGPTTGENARFEFFVKYGIKELGSMNYIIYDRI